MKIFIPATAALALALGACSEPVDTTAEPAVQEDQELVEELTADETPPTEVTGATVNEGEAEMDGSDMASDSSDSDGY